MPVLIRNRRGASAVEYLVMIILAAMVILAIMRVFGSTIKDKYQNANDELSGTLADSPRSGSGSGKDGAGGGGSGSGKSGSGSGSQGKSGSGSGDGEKSGGGSGGGGGSGSAANGSGSGGGGGGGGGGNSSGVSGGNNAGGAGLDGGGDGKKAPEDEGPGFNPIILLAALGLVGLLIFVMTKGKDG